MTRALPMTLALLLPLMAACSGDEPCAVPGVATACPCGAGTGARVCSADHAWSECDCSGNIALPVAVMPSQPSGGTGASGMGGAGTGGPKPKPDASVMRDSGSSDASEPDAASDAGSTPASAYRACMSDTECDTGAKCIITSGVPASSTACAPACLDAVDCPKPEGTYEAKVACVTGFCQLDCTPVLFAPLLTCPADMTCIVAALGAALCEHAGM